MRPDRLFGNLPPKRPLISLNAIVEDWQMRFIEGDAKKFRDTVVDYCIKATSWEMAIMRACKCRNELGKKHNHQSKVQDITLDRWARVLQNETRPDMYNNFDQLFDHLEHLLIWGIGPVTHYDVATRIGAYLKLEPEQLYLHAGVLDGWKQLEYNSGPVTRKVKWPIRIPRDSWPAELRCLPADQVEDLLCAYRTFLNPTVVGVA